MGRESWPKPKNGKGTKKKKPRKEIREICQILILTVLRWWRISYFDLIYTWLMIGKGDGGIRQQCMVSTFQLNAIHTHTVTSLERLIV